MKDSVLVVGAGPVGLTAALMLARHGTPVRIIDQNDGQITLSKAWVLWRRTLQVLDALPKHGICVKRQTALSAFTANDCRHA